MEQKMTMEESTKSAPKSRPSGNKKHKTVTFFVIKAVTFFVIQNKMHLQVSEKCQWVAKTSKKFKNIMWTKCEKVGQSIVLFPEAYNQTT